MFQVFRAPADLSHWVDGAVVIRLGPTPGVSCFPAVPHAMLTLRLARPAGAPWALCPPITFHTLSTEPMVHAHVGDTVAMGLLVRPEAAACLLGAATGAVVNQVLAWHTLSGAAEAARLDDAVEGARTDIARLRALADSFRRTMAAVSRGRDAACARLCAAVGDRGAQAGDDLGLGRRQLERRCQAVLGLGPKQFQRLVRFHRVLSMAVAGGALPGAALAHDTGFFDQSHLAREVRALAGAPLGRLLEGARPDAAWWPLATRLGRSTGLVLPAGRGGPSGG
ncbi:helix-turn-helix domain-containing protein [Ideonella sp. A 288]|uniref:AraC family transcriptional regulator n=1 Tax=Ideonella sp. A 288 TaxID=1962181 RepID=UPI001303C258|nr:helix-turn-helix domain-containing protein [Ideonella sp. A 288]